MSNIFRIKIKKKKAMGGSGHNSDMGAHVQIVGPAEPKRKPTSVTTQPDLSSSPSHQVSHLHIFASIF